MTDVLITGLDDSFLDSIEEDAKRDGRSRLAQIKLMLRNAKVYKDFISDKGLRLKFEEYFAKSGREKINIED